MTTFVNKTAGLIFKSCVICLAVALAGCKQHSFSPVLEGKFDPVHNFESDGYVVQNFGENGAKNLKAGYAWHAWQGRVIIPKGKNGCETLAKLIRQALINANGQGCLDNLTPKPGLKKDNWLFGELIYSHQDVEGEAHIWLIPDESESGVSYVILVSERK